MAKPNDPGQQGHEQQSGQGEQQQAYTLMTQEGVALTVRVNPGGQVHLEAQQPTPEQQPAESAQADESQPQQ